MPKELTTTVRFELDTEGRIAGITLPDHLPEMELSRLMTFLSCLEQAKTKEGRV